MSDKKEQNRKLYDDVIKSLKEKESKRTAVDAEDIKDEAKKASSFKDNKKDIDEFFEMTKENTKIKEKVNKEAKKEKKNKVDEAATNFSEEEKKQIKRVNNKKLLIILFIQIIVLSLLVYAGLTKMSIIKNDIDNAKTGAFNKLPDSLDMVNGDVPEEFEGTKVLGQMIIKDISLDKYIFANEGDNLKKGVVLLNTINGINNIGNTSFIGHNDNRVFDELDKLKEGSIIQINTNNHGNKKYKVIEKKEVDEDDFDVLLSDKNRKITLLTCLKSNDKKRLAIIAEGE